MPAVRRGEHEALAAATRPSAKVVVDLVDNDGGQCGWPTAGARLDRLERPATGLVATELLDNLHVPMEQVDAMASQPGQLTEAETAVRADDHESPVALVNDIGERCNLHWREAAHLLRLDPRRLDPVERITREHVVLHR